MGLENPDVLVRAQENVYGVNYVLEDFVDLAFQSIANKTQIVKCMKNVSGIGAFHGGGQLYQKFNECHLFCV